MELNNERQDYLHKFFYLLKNKVAVIELTESRIIKGKIANFQFNEDSKDLGSYILIQSENSTDIVNISLRDIFLIKILNITDEFSVDSKLKEEIKYKDDFETFKKKIMENKIEPSDVDITTNTSINQYNNSLHGHGYDEKLEMFLEEHTEQNWDQFIINKEKYNVDTTYSENKYTTTLDKDNISDKIKMEAELIEKSIINDKCTHRHVNEERIGKGEKLNNYEEVDEEFRYSSVYRNTKSNKSTHFSWHNLFLIFIFVLFITYFIWRIYSQYIKYSQDQLDEYDEYEYDD